MTASKRPPELRVALRTPHGPLRQRAALGFVIGGAVLFASTYGSRMALGLQIIAAGVLGFAAFLAWGAVRVKGWKDFGLRLSDREIEAPVRPLTRRATRTVPLEEIEMVSYAATGGGPRIIILARSDVLVLPFEWFPPEYPATEIALRIHVRSQLLRGGATLEPGELAAIEATMIAGKTGGALIVAPLDGPPEAIATYDDDAERARLEAEHKGRGAQTIDCSARIKALREGLERGLSYAPGVREAAPEMPARGPNEADEQLDKEE